MKRTLGFMLVGAAVLAACDTDGLGPRSGPLILETSIGRSTLRALDTTSIVFRVRNVGSEAISVDFSGCTLRTYVQTWDNSPVMQTGGCRRQDERLIPPGGEATKSIAIRACTPYFGEILLQNRYEAYAQFVHPDYAMRSRTIEFIIVCP